MTERAVAAAPIRPTLVIPFVLACAVIADRTQIAVSTGGRGALSLLVLAPPLGAMVAVAAYGRDRSLRFFGHPIFILGVLPYIAMSAILPLLGVIVFGFPERTLIAVTDATTAISFLVIGATLSTRDGRSWTPWLFGAILIQFAYALGQAIYQARGPGWELFAPFHDWDVLLQGQSGIVVLGRSSGFYVNPNVLGMWAGVAAILAWTMLPARLRFAATSMAIVTLLLSQSRGATVALACAVIAGVLVSLAQGRMSVSSGSKAAATFGVVALLAGATVVLIGIPGSAVERSGSLLAVLAQGPQADPNLAGRLDYWSAVTALNSIYPWGTWGPPGLLLGTAVDSSWFQAFAQGSVPYAGALGLSLVAALRVGLFRSHHALSMIAVFVAVAALTQTPFGYAPIVLFWVLLGAGLQSSVASRIPRRAIPRWPTRSDPPQSIKETARTPG